MKVVFQEICFILRLIFDVVYNLFPQFFLFIYYFLMEMNTQRSTVLLHI